MRGRGVDLEGKNPAWRKLAQGGLNSGGDSSLDAGSERGKPRKARCMDIPVSGIRLRGKETTWRLLGFGFWCVGFGGLCLWRPRENALIQKAAGTPAKERGSEVVDR